MDENQKLNSIKVDCDGLSCIKIYTYSALEFDSYKKKHLLT